MHNTQPSFLSANLMITCASCALSLCHGGTTILPSAEEVPQNILVRYISKCVHSLMKRCILWW